MSTEAVSELANSSRRKSVTAEGVSLSASRKNLPGHAVSSDDRMQRRTEESTG